MYSKGGDKFVEKEGRSWRDPDFPQEDSHPVVCLSWSDAKAYVDWLAKETQQPYRLLSEAEFEYAARARTTPGTYPRFWFGNDEKELCRYGNGADEKARDTIRGWKRDRIVAPCTDGFAYTSPVGHFAPNNFGLYDMFGNAWQWMADCWHGSYMGPPDNGSAWTSPWPRAGSCFRVLRGGSWFNIPKGLRAANHIDGDNNFDNPSNIAGFRVGRTLVAP